MSTTPYWLDEPADEFPPIDARGRAEVAVIGGGVTGCSCALTLAERGVRVRLYEQRRVAGGASGRNGGFASRGPALPYDLARNELGVERARLLMSLTERSLDRMERLAGDAFRRVGIVRLAADADEADALRRELEALRADGFAAEWLAELAGPARSPVRRARFCTRPTARSRRHAGSGGSPGSRPTRGPRSSKGRAVSVDEVDADAVVVCGDGFTASLLPELGEVVVPTRGQMLATAPLRELRYPQPACRARRLRLLAAATRRTPRDRRQP